MSLVLVPVLANLLVSPSSAAKVETSPTAAFTTPVESEALVQWPLVRSTLIDRLQTQVRRVRHRALMRGARLGVTLDVRPLSTRSAAYLLWLRHAWTNRAADYQTQIQALSAPTPTPVAPVAPAASGSLIADFNCISEHEEYGVTGQNTWAGYFGMVSPPSAYPEPGPTYAAQYGDSWLDIPLSAQYQIAIAEYNVYGWSPWSTAGACGL